MSQERTLQERLESAKAGLNHAISRSYKTGYDAQADMITLYQNRVNELTKQIQEGK
jgi:hypothetical protein